MDHKETDICGSFVELGTGFEYKYDHNARTIYVGIPQQETPLLTINLDRQLSKSPRAYIATFDKTSQINALIYSNSSSIILSEIFEPPHLNTVLHAIALQARYSIDLQRENFEHFEYIFCQNGSLNRLNIYKFRCTHKSSAFYKAEMETKNYNSISCSASTLPNLLNDLSQKTVSDLISKEYGFKPYSDAAQNLLSASSNLSIMSKVLNKDFTPVHRIKRINQNLNQTDTAT